MLKKIKLTRRKRDYAHKTLSVYAAAALLGVLTGAIGSLFLLAINGVSALMAKGFDFSSSRGWPVGLISAIVSMVMIYTSWLMVKWIATEASGSGVQEIEGTLMRVRPIYWRRLLPVKFFGGVLAISSKLVVGREGPTIQIGGNLGEMLGEWLKMPRHRRDSLIAAGAAAGLATAFNAPLAGILFVLEEMRAEFNFSFTNFTAVSICCVMAVIVLHLIVGAEPAIPMHVFDLPSLQSLWLFFIFGIVVGLVGLIFNIVLMKSLYRIDKLSPLMRDVYVVLVGLLVGILVYIRPEAVGGGYEIIEMSLTMNPPFLALLLIVGGRFITTMLSYNTGVPGGIFAPMLALGTLLGLAASHIFKWVMVDFTVHPGMFAVAGMGALFAAVVRAPITGIVLVVEMTQNYSLILPLMVTCLTATTVVQLAGNPPIYTQLLRRTLRRQASS
jgi:CIC family chloride channel protein